MGHDNNNPLGDLIGHPGFGFANPGGFRLIRQKRQNVGFKREPRPNSKKNIEG
jgi:hypothetical protein